MQPVKNAVAAAKEKTSNAAATTKEKLDKTKASAEEKVIQNIYILWVSYGDNANAFGQSFNRLS